MPNLWCDNCERSLNDVNFYVYKNGDKTKKCKKCLTMFVNPFDPETFLWLLQEMDVPYLYWEWNTTRDRALEKDPKTTATAIFGKYLSKMKLKPRNKQGWADTEWLTKEHDEQKARSDEQKAEEEALAKQQFDAGEISEAQYKTMTTLESRFTGATPAMLPPSAVGGMYDESQFVNEEDLPDPAANLTEDEKIYLAVKWGRYYKPNECVELENLYRDMTKSFAIEDADSINTLKLICKTTLKANQALDCGDIDGFQKLSRVLDAQRKSAKFTAAQNKKEESSSFDSVCAIVEFCEAEGGFIPRHQITTPFDIADRDIIDMKNYNKRLIEEDPTVFKQVEQYIKKREILQQMEENGTDATDRENIVEDKDFQDYRDSIEKQRKEDNEEENKGQRRINGLQEEVYLIDPSFDNEEENE